MSLKIMPMPPIPEETARVARAAFPRGTRAVCTCAMRWGRCTPMRILLTCCRRVVSRLKRPGGWRW